MEADCVWACATCAPAILDAAERLTVVGLGPHGERCGGRADGPHELRTGATGRLDHLLVCADGDGAMIAEHLGAVLGRHAATNLLVLLARREPAPDVMVRDDETEVRSYMASADVAGRLDLDRSAAETVEQLIGPDGLDVLVAQLPPEPAPTPNGGVGQAERTPATWVIAHQGDLRLLDGCLRAVAAASGRRDAMAVAFDEDVGPAHVELAQRHPHAEFRRVDPPGTGPYLPRHVLASEATTPLIAWQDADDVPTLDRLEILDTTRRATGAAMVGCQEVRIDPATKTMRIRRFALDPVRPLEAGLAGAMLVGAAIVTTEAFRELGGYSTDLRYGADLQFLFRASLTHRLANTNEVLYLRRVRPDSQTNDPTTGFASKARKVQQLTWRMQLANVRRGALRLERSALAPTRLGDERQRVRPLQD